VQSGVAISAELKDLEGKRLNAVTGSLTVDSALQLAGRGLWTKVCVRTRAAAL